MPTPREQCFARHDTLKWRRRLEDRNMWEATFGVVLVEYMLQQSRYMNVLGTSNHTWIPQRINRPLRMFDETEVETKAKPHCRQRHHDIKGQDSRNGTLLTVSSIFSTYGRERSRNWPVQEIPPSVNSNVSSIRPRSRRSFVGNSREWSKFSHAPGFIGVLRHNLGEM